MDRKKYTYMAIFTREEDGGYSVRFPQLDGCLTQGDNFEDARLNAIDAMRLHLYGMEQDGEEIPIPKRIAATKSGEMTVRITAKLPFSVDKNVK